MPTPFAAVLSRAGTLAMRPLLALLAARVGRLSAPVMNRLQCASARRLLLVFDELPVCLLVELAGEEIRLDALPRAQDQPPADATVRGPLAALIEVAAGRSDGDALFFSREITIEGDTAFIVALRNALDDLQFDPLAVLPLPDLVRARLRSGLMRAAEAGERLVRLARAVTVDADPLVSGGGAGGPAAVRHANARSFQQ